MSHLATARPAVVDWEQSITQITVRLPDALVEALDAAAMELKRSRADVVRQALERYLEDFDGLTGSGERLRDSADPVPEWDQVRRELLDLD